MRGLSNFVLALKQTRKVEAFLVNALRSTVTCSNPRFFDLCHEKIVYAGFVLYAARAMRYCSWLVTSG